MKEVPIWQRYTLTIEEAAAYRDMQYVIEDTKTTSGTRQLPMTEEVYECFKRILANRKPPKVEPMITDA